MKFEFARLTLIAALAASVPVGRAAAPNGGDQPLKIVQTTEVQYPASLQASGRNHDEVSVIICVESDGRLADCYVASYTRPELVDGAVRALREWRYEPMRRNGGPVGVRTVVTFGFERSPRAASRISIEVAQSFLDSMVRQVAVRQVFQPDELERAPEAVKTVAPLHPGANSAERSVVVDFLIDEHGAPRMPVVVEGGEGLYAIAAVKALEQWRFTPPMRDGRPVAVVARQQFIFPARFPAGEATIPPAKS